MSKQAISMLVTSLLSAGMFLVALASGLDFIFLFVSTLPLFSVGFGQDPKITLKAGVLAALIIASITASFPLTALFFLAFALPCWYICDSALHYYDIKLSPSLPSVRLWYPMGLIAVHLVVYGCVLLALITAFFATQDINLPQQIIKIVQTEINNLSAIYEIKLAVSPASISFMLCGFLTWVWTILLIIHAWAANRALIQKNLAKRASLAITPFPIPHWFLTLMSICALASLIGGESMSFLGKSSLIILFLPYFFQGMAMLHIRSKNWSNRQFFLFFIYFTIIALLWPALMIAGTALWNHIKILNKHLSSGGSSSKN